MAADQDVVGLRQRRAADQRVHAVQIAASRGAPPIVKCLGEASLRANEGRLVRWAPGGDLVRFCRSHQHLAGSALELHREMG
jgi:hypothetical protein